MTTPVLDDAAVHAIGAATTENQATRVVEELGIVARAVAGSRPLARALDSTGIPLDSKIQLIVSLAPGVHPATTEILKSALSASGFDVTRFIELPIAVAVESAMRGDALSVAGGCNNIALLIDSNQGLAWFLSDPSRSDAEKVSLMDDLLGSAGIDGRVVEISRIAVLADHGRNVARKLGEVATEIGERAGFVVADITTAIDIDEPKRSAIIDALGRTTNKSVLGRFSIDSSIIGSVVVRIGDEVYDDSIRHRLEAARKVLVS